MIEPVTPDSRVRPEVDKNWGVGIIILVILLILTVALSIICVRIFLRRAKERSINKLLASGNLASEDDENH